MKKLIFILVIVIATLLAKSVFAISPVYPAACDNRTETKYYFTVVKNSPCVIMSSQYPGVKEVTIKWVSPSGKVLRNDFYVSGEKIFSYLKNWPKIAEVGRWRVYVTWRNSCRPIDYKSTTFNVGYALALNSTILLGR